MDKNFVHENVTIKIGISADQKKWPRWLYLYNSNTPWNPILTPFYLSVLSPFIPSSLIVPSLFLPSFFPSFLPFFTYSSIILLFIISISSFLSSFHHLVISSPLSSLFFISFCPPSFRYLPSPLFPSFTFLTLLFFLQINLS